MMEVISKLLESATVGNVLNIIALIITGIGFVVTIQNSRKALNAAQAAQAAIERVRDDIKRVNTVADFSTALTMSEEIKRLHREPNWHILPDRYSTLKGHIISIRTIYKDFSEEQQIMLQQAILELNSLEKAVNRHLMAKDKDATSSPDMYKLNNSFTAAMDNLKEILIHVKNDIGG